MRELRERAGLSCRALGRMADVSSSLVGYIEAGERSGKTKAEPFAKVLGCSLDWLIAGKGEAPTEQELETAVKRAVALDKKDKARGGKAA